MNIEYQAIPPTEQNLIQLASVRYNAYNIHSEPLPKDNFYIKELKKKKY